MLRYFDKCMQLSLFVPSCDLHGKELTGETQTPRLTELQQKTQPANRYNVNMLSSRGFNCRLKVLCCITLQCRDNVPANKKVDCRPRRTLFRSSSTAHCDDLRFNVCIKFTAFPHQGNAHRNQRLFCQARSLI